MIEFRNNLLLKLFFVLGAICTLGACDDPYENSTYINEDIESPISTMLDNDTNYTKWMEIVKYAEMFNALNQATQAFTVFVPSNDAVVEFYQKKGVTSIEELGTDFARSLVQTHTCLDSLKVENFVQLISFTNLSGDKVYVNIDDTESRKPYLMDAGHTSMAPVDEMGIHAYNGSIYTLSGVLNPLIETVYDRVAQGFEGDENYYSIMREALEQTGWADSLKVIADTIKYSGSFNNIQRRYYTLLTVSDATFQKDDISSFNGLVAKLGAGSDYTNPDNELNQYVSYHILRGEYSISNFINPFLENSDTVRLWDTAAENQVFTITKKDTLYNIDTSFSFNEQAVSAHFSRNSNVFAKNGYVHEIDGYLPVWEPEQTGVLWDLADYVEVRSAVGSFYYQPSAPVANETKISIMSAACYNYEASEAGVGGNSYSYITYVTCKNNLKEAHNYDRVVFNLGYMGWASMKTPTLVRGKYRVELDFIYMTDHSFMRTMSDGNGGLLKFTIDDKNELMSSPYTTVTKTTTGVYSTVLYDEVEFETTASHMLKFIVMDPSASTNSKFSLQFDCIRFIPITE